MWMNSRFDIKEEHIKKSEDGKVDFNSIDVSEPVDHTSFCYWPSYYCRGLTVKTFTDEVKRYRLDNKTNLV